MNVRLVYTFSCLKNKLSITKMKNLVNKSFIQRYSSEQEFERDFNRAYDQIIKNRKLKNRKQSKESESKFSLN